MPFSRYFDLASSYQDALVKSLAVLNRKTYVFTVDLFKGLGIGIWMVVCFTMEMLPKPLTQQFKKNYGDYRIINITPR